MLTLYYNPGSCSLASHAALEEAGIEHRLVKIDLAAGANEAPEYLEKNIWGRVPALEVDGIILTENIAILSYIADRAEQGTLLPPIGSFERIRALEWLALLSSTVHVAFRPLFRPGRLATTEAGQADVAAVGLASLNRTLAALERKIGESTYALGERISLVDLYLFVFLLWMQRPVLAGKLEPRPGLDALCERLVDRPSIRRAMVAEGLIQTA
ncbi:glutathione S-transferase family protein [Sphingobium sp. B2]|uniref:glutathione S-transferase family protein n=1 Tax=Sphingobium sp. B2 TaxID=2583228 RepID=UPI0011A4101B|nr:glutathione binding-like protein [Sphingobium sp. B2]